MRILVLTGYASIATAVKAIKLGADDYLTKPATATTIAAALRGMSLEDVGGASELCFMSPRRLEWEHIQRVLAEQDGNVSATARALSIGCMLFPRPERDLVCVRLGCQANHDVLGWSARTILDEQTR